MARRLAISGNGPCLLWQRALPLVATRAVARSSISEIRGIRGRKKGYSWSGKRTIRGREKGYSWSGKKVAGGPPALPVGGLWCRPRWWSWRELNPRPNRGIMSFLHAYLSLGFRAVARPELPTTALSSVSFIPGARPPWTIPLFAAPLSQSAGGLEVSE